MLHHSWAAATFRTAVARDTHLTVGPLPPQMWIRVYKPQRGLKRFLRALNVICFLITLATVIGSVVRRDEKAGNGLASDGGARAGSGLG